MWRTRRQVGRWPRLQCVGATRIMTRSDATTCKKQHKKKNKEENTSKRKENANHKIRMQWTHKTQDKKQGKGLDEQGPLIFMVKCKVHIILKY